MLTVEFMQLEERYPSMTEELGRDITNLINHWMKPATAVMGCVHRFV